MMDKLKSIFFALFAIVYLSESAKINTPRVLLPWFENLNVNFTFEIHEGGCYTWSLSRDDIIDLEPLYEDTWGHCSRSARVSVSKACVSPGSVIILAEEVSSGEILRGDVDIDKIHSLEVMSTTWTLYLEEAPEAFEVFAYDKQGNKFSTLEGVSFTWSIENIGNSVGEELLVKIVRWTDTDYEAPKGIAELEAQGLYSHAILLYGQAMGQCQVTACIQDICTSFKLQVIASVVLMPATAMIVPGDTLKYRVVRAKAGRLTIQDISETLYYLQVPETSIALLEDTVSLVRGLDIGTTTIQLLSGSTEVAVATLTVVEPHSIRVTLRPPNLLIKDDVFVIHCAVLDSEGHVLTAGNEILIRLTVDGEANVDLIQSTENGTLTDAIANNAGGFTVTAKLHSIAGKILSKKVEGQVSAIVVEPLEIVPPEVFVAWTDNIQEINLKHRGGGDEEVVWSESETIEGPLSLSPDGLVTVRGVGDIGVKVHLKKYPYVKATGRVWSAPFELVQVSSTGYARVGRPHLLHIALTATHPVTGELYNFNRCDCDSFTLTLLEGPEPQNVTSATWIEPIEGACCVVSVVYPSRGVSACRVSRARAGAVSRVTVRAAPALLWPARAAALLGGTLPVLAEGEALVTHSSDARVAELTVRDGPPPHRHPDVQLFTFKCRRKGEVRLDLTSHIDEEPESVQLDAACAPHVSRVRLEPPDAPADCTAGNRLWLRPGHEVSLKVTLFDAIGRELLDEHGPKLSWDIEPYHAGIEYKTTDRLFVESHPDYAPVPVPYKYYQMVLAENKAIGWSGVLKASIPDATASIQAKVVAPLRCDPIKVNIAWEGDTLSNIVSITGGSGRYTVDSPKGTTATLHNNSLTFNVPGPGSYDVVISDMCIQGEKQVIEVNVEEILSVEVLSPRAVCVDACAEVQVLVRGVSRRSVALSRGAALRVSGDLSLHTGRVCGLREGSGIVRATLAQHSSNDHEVIVFPPLEIIPRSARVPPGGRLQLRHHGGPPSHLASLHYELVSSQGYIEVTSSGTVNGVSMGKARVRLVALDIGNIEMASAESEIEVIPISELRVRSATQTLLVGQPSPVWVEAGGLSTAALAALTPQPRVTYTLRDPTAARLYTTHLDDKLERSVAESLSVRVVPLKTGVIAIDVRVRNMGQVAETRSWDSTIEILGITDIRTSIDGQTEELSPGDLVSIAVGSNIRLKALPRGTWMAYEDGAFELTPSGEIKAQKPGYGVVIAQHKDDRNNIYRERAIHVHVSVPVYCTAQSGAAGAVCVVLRDGVGRALLAPHANVSAHAPLSAVRQYTKHSIHGPELLISGLDAAGAFMTFQATSSGVTVKDEVWVAGSDARGERIVVTAGWGVCIAGGAWRAAAGVAVAGGSAHSLALLTRTDANTHTLTQDRTHHTITLHQLPLQKMSFLPGEWPASLVPLSFAAEGLTSGPLLCTEEQRYALEGVQVQLPFTCLTNQPHIAEPVLDIINDQIGCRIIPATPVTDAFELELCAEWGIFRTCTKVLLVPPIHVSSTKVSLLQSPAVFTISGHPKAMSLVKLTTSPGLKLDIDGKPGEMTVTVINEALTCGVGWVTVKSKLTSQEIRVDIERKCEVACGSLLGALLSLLSPYLSTIFTMAAVAGAYMYVQARMQRKSPLLQDVPSQSVLPPSPSNTAAGRRSWSRSPHATPSHGVPVYGDVSTLNDTSFSPNTSRTHSRFL